MNRLPKRSFWMLFVGYLGSTLIILGFLIAPLMYFGVLALLENQRWYCPLLYILGTLVLLTILGCFVWAWVNIKEWRYEIGKKSFEVKYGIINKKSVSVPYNRIQNVNLNQGLVGQKLGLTRLSIQTAGDSSRGYGPFNRSEAYLPGIEDDRAEELKIRIMQRSK